MKQMDPVPVGVGSSGWKARGFQETKTAIIRGGGERIEADLLMHKK